MNEYNIRKFLVSSVFENQLDSVRYNPETASHLQWSIN